MMSSLLHVRSIPAIRFMKLILVIKVVKIISFTSAFEISFVKTRTKKIENSRLDRGIFGLCYFRAVIFTVKYIQLRSTLNKNVYFEILGGIYFVYWTIFECTTTFLLWKGIYLRSKRFLRWFIIIQSRFLAPGVVITILVNVFPLLPTPSYFTLWGFVKIFIFALSTLFSIYTILVVRVYYKKLESPIMARLFDYCKRMKDLESGCNGSGASGPSGEVDPKKFEEIPKIFSCKRFKKCIISPLDVIIDTNHVLGKGEFGTVYKGAVLIGKTQLKIAAKVAKEIETYEAVEMILQEIKILIHVGNHENIIKFYGVTSDATLKDHIAIISELCTEGNLCDFLKKYRAWYVRHFDKTITTETEPNPSPPGGIRNHSYLNVKNDGCGCHSGSDLERFSVEIARGMSYLTKKKIIHGDLAARNVLLTNQRTAKISDFGVSKRLYNYQMYCVSGKNLQLPWRWMSIEAIEDLKFSEKSDVWAFGIVLWEIFSLGECPYHDMQWSSSFALLLRNGTRLQKPKYSSDFLYRLMQTCWINCPKERPNFSKLKSILEETISRLSIKC